MQADRAGTENKWFARFTRRESILDADLWKALERVGLGLVDADLGGGLIKQRVARRGQGRSGGYRIVLAYRAESRAVFLYAFAKNERENLHEVELNELRQLGRNWLDARPGQIAQALKEGVLQEIDHDDS